MFSLWVSLWSGHYTISGRLRGGAITQAVVKNTKEVIANSLETDLYSPLPKDQAKERLEIPDDAVTFLFGAIDGSEKRKGFAELTGAIKSCLENKFFQELLRKNQLRLLCFGSPNDQLESIGIPVVSLGRLGTDEEIRNAYSAADIFLLPSLEDNLPNTILESMSCATPVVAFDVGGVPDMVTDGVNGLLVKAFNTQQMGKRPWVPGFVPFTTSCCFRPSSLTPLMFTSSGT